MFNINLPYLAIRLLTVACYFLPFIFFLSTCTDGNSREAYNITEAMVNEKEKYVFLLVIQLLTEIQLNRTNKPVGTPNCKLMKQIAFI